MGLTKKASAVKLVIGLIFKETAALAKAKAALRREFGQSDFSSEIMPFHHTAYYEKEFGQGLKRQFIAFRGLVSPSELWKIKILTNKIEAGLSCKGKRKVNIDPGCLDLAKLVLATTKDYKHRIYLRGGIYAEVTLYYQDKTFKPWEWTYPDYQSREYLEIFNRIREIYARQLLKL